MSHSEPTLYDFLLLMSIILFASCFVSLWLAVACYLWAGFLVWVVLEGECSFIKTVLFWYWAILLDRSEWLD